MGVVECAGYLQLKKKWTSVMASCLRTFNLLPNRELAQRLQDNSVSRHDLGMRVTSVAAFWMAVIGIVMIGVAAASYAHPAIGISLVSGAFLLTAISSCIGCGLEKRLQVITMNELYHPADDADDASSYASATSQPESD